MERDFSVFALKYSLSIGSKAYGDVPCEENLVVVENRRTGNTIENLQLVKGKTTHDGYGTGAPYGYYIGLRYFAFIIKITLTE